MQRLEADLNKYFADLAEESPFQPLRYEPKIYKNSDDNYHDNQYYSIHANIVGRLKNPAIQAHQEKFSLYCMLHSLGETEIQKIKSNDKTIPFHFSKDKNILEQQLFILLNRGVLVNQSIDILQKECGYSNELIDACKNRFHFDVFQWEKIEITPSKVNLSLSYNALINKIKNDEIECKKTCSYVSENKIEILKEKIKQEMVERKQAAEEKTKRLEMEKTREKEAGEENIEKADAVLEKGFSDKINIINIAINCINKYITANKNFYLFYQDDAFLKAKALFEVLKDSEKEDAYKMLLIYMSLKEDAPETRNFTKSVSGAIKTSYKVDAQFKIENLKKILSQYFATDIIASQEFRNNLYNYSQEDVFSYDDISAAYDEIKKQVEDDEALKSKLIILFQNCKMDCQGFSLAFYGNLGNSLIKETIVQILNSLEQNSVDWGKLEIDFQKYLKDNTDLHLHPRARCSNLEPVPEKVFISSRINGRSKLADTLRKAIPLVEEKIKQKNIVPQQTTKNTALSFKNSFTNY